MLVGRQEEEEELTNDCPHGGHACRAARCRLEFVREKLEEFASALQQRTADLYVKYAGTCRVFVNVQDGGQLEIAQDVSSSFLRASELVDQSAAVWMRDWLRCGPRTNS